LPVEHARAGDGDVRLVQCVNQRRIIPALHAFPESRHNGQVALRVGKETQGCAFLKMQVHAGAQMDGAGEPVALRDDDAPAAGLMAGADGRGDGFRAVALAVAARAVAGDVEVTRRKLGRPDAFEQAGGVAPAGAGLRRDEGGHWPEGCGSGSGAQKGAPRGAGRVCRHIHLLLWHGRALHGRRRANRFQRTGTSASVC
jgi:hypothetical protein